MSWFVVAEMLAIVYRQHIRIAWKSLMHSYEIAEHITESTSRSPVAQLSFLAGIHQKADYFHPSSSGLVQSILLYVVEKLLKALVDVHHYRYPCGLHPHVPEAGLLPRSVFIHLALQIRICAMFSPSL